VIKGLIAQIALDRHPSFLQLHAGVVSSGESCIVLPGAPGSGKSTLTIGLMLAGYAYFSDEVALLEEESLRLRPFPLAIGIKAGAIPALESCWPHLQALEAHSREDGQEVRYLAPPKARCAALNHALPARWLVFPRYDAQARTELRAIGRPEALRRLMQEFMVLPKLLDEARVESMVRWMRRLECFELSTSSLPEAVDLLRRRCPLPA
jgi:hypothetical protein